MTSEITGGYTELEAVLLRASDLPDIFYSRLYVLEVIDFRTIIETAVERQRVLLRAISGKSKLASKIRSLAPNKTSCQSTALSIIVRESITSNTNKPKVKISGRSLALNKTA